MVFVAHFIRYPRTLMQMALVCKAVPGERDKVRSTVVLTTYQQIAKLSALEDFAWFSGKPDSHLIGEKKQSYASPSAGRMR